MSYVNNISVSTQATDTTVIPSSAPAPSSPVRFYAISDTKLIVLSILTIGLFEIYWLYKNWWAIRDMEKSKVVPIGRAIFAVFYSFQLFEKMIKKANDAGYKGYANVGILGGNFIILNILSNLVSRMHVNSLALDIAGYILVLPSSLSLLYSARQIFIITLSTQPMSHRIDSQKLKSSGLLLPLL